MAITNSNFIVAPQYDGSPGILTGSGAPAAEVRDLGMLYVRDDAVGAYMSDGAGTWTQILDDASAVPQHEATATSAAGTGATGSTSTAVMATESFAAPAAKAVACHAQIVDNDVTPIAAGWTAPAIPRNLRIAFGAAWGVTPGGDVTVTGTDQDDAVATEVFVANPANTVVGAVIFKTITQATFGAGIGGAGHTIDVSTGDKLGIIAPFAAAVGIAAVDGVLDLAVFSATLHQRGFTPASLPNGAKNYAVTVPSTAVGHTHTGPSHTHNTPVLTHTITA